MVLPSDDESKPKCTTASLTPIFTINRFGKDLAEQFKCTYRKVFLEGYTSIEIMGAEVLKPFRDLIMEFPGDWAYEGICNEPF
jgi:hypothetical protein